MKNLLLLLFVVLSFTACSEKPTEAATTTETPKASNNTIDDKIKAYMAENANDPASYEPIKTAFVDTVTYQENLTDVLESTNRKISLYTTDIMKEEKDRLSKVASDYQAQKDSLAASANPHAVAAIVYQHDCRMKNGVGALTKYSYQVETDAAGNILEVFDLQDNTRRVTYPGGFPK